MVKALRVKFENEENLQKFIELMELDKKKITNLVASYNFENNTYTYRNKLNKPYTPTEVFKEKVKILNTYTDYKYRDDKPYTFTIFKLTDEVMAKWEKKLNKKSLKKTRSIWFPERVKRTYRSTTYTTISNSQQSKYPIYIVSKNRWQKERSKTANFLTANKIHFNIVVERDQYKQYKEAMDENYCRVLIIPNRFFLQYKTHDEVGDAKGKSKGSGCARNFAWEHSIKCGHKKHWVMDDNIASFYSFYNNRKLRVYDKGWFKMFEDFADSFPNVKMAGPNYCFFVSESQVYAPYVNNTRVYSCNLITNHIIEDGLRWRGRYNEDTLLSMDILSKGYDTLLTNFLLQDKATTMTVKGGNCDEIYKDGTKEKSEIMVREYPKQSKLTWKYKRWHHEINYKGFARKEYKINPVWHERPKLTAYKIANDEKINIDNI